MSSSTRRSEPLSQPYVEAKLAPFVSKADQRESVADAILEQDYAVYFRPARSEVLRVSNCEFFCDPLADRDASRRVIAPSDNKRVNREAAQAEQPLRASLQLFRDTSS
jgi:hypothetical protein